MEFRSRIRGTVQGPMARGGESSPKSSCRRETTKPSTSPWPEWAPAAATGNVPTSSIRSIWASAWLVWGHATASHAGLSANGTRCSSRPVPFPARSTQASRDASPSACAPPSAPARLAASAPISLCTWKGADTEEAQAGSRRRVQPGAADTAWFGRCTSERRGGQWNWFIFGKWRGGGR